MVVVVGLRFFIDKIEIFRQHRLDFLLDTFGVKVIRFDNVRQFTLNVQLVVLVDDSLVENGNLDLVWANFDAQVTLVNFSNIFSLTWTLFN